ncbi:MAG: hypothetical protein SFX72_22445 [Isosphaeraceae bacterium]|nr:hypothetical protein [Isosphaeraceae bacterium]
MDLRSTRSILAAIVGFSSISAACLAFQQLGQVGQAGRDVATPPPFGGDATLTFAGLGGTARPTLPPQGDWAEVIKADNRWLVIQNGSGQQFPISYENVRQFFVRWPGSIDDAAADALVEVTGVDIGSNGLRTDHIDIYEEAARTLVSPTFLRLVGFNRVYSAIDVVQESNYGIYFPMTPAEYAIPRRLHVVGPILARSPLQLAIEGNNAVTVYPAPTGVSVTQVTVGNPSIPKVGDRVYFVAESAEPKTLTVSQLVLYKNTPFRLGR